MQANEAVRDEIFVDYTFVNQVRRRSVSSLRVSLM
jgi:hypothetical protein